MGLEVANAVGIVAALTAHSPVGRRPLPGRPRGRDRRATSGGCASSIPRCARRRAADSPAEFFARRLPPGRLRELRESRPDDCATSLVADAAAQAVEAADAMHVHSPGGPAFGRRFLGRGAALARASVPAAARLDGSEYDALFLSASAFAMPSPRFRTHRRPERVHVGVTPAAPARTLGERDDFDLDERPGEGQLRDLDRGPRGERRRARARRRRRSSRRSRRCRAGRRSSSRACRGPLPASARIAARLSKQRCACSAIPPSTSFPVAGSIGTWPETNTSPSATIALRVGRAGDGRRCAVGANDGLGHAGSMAPIVAPPSERSASSTVHEMHVKIGVSRSV